jgi:hypothetical protein
MMAKPPIGQGETDVEYDLRMAREHPDRYPIKRCSGSWNGCPYAHHTLVRMWPVMRCRVTGKHPDECVRG